MKRSRHSLIALLLGVCLAPVAFAQDSGDVSAAQANNPLANTTAFNIQDYYIGELTNSNDDANQLILRYAAPMSFRDTNWLIRASLPFNTFPTGNYGGAETGLGDADVFAAYLIDTGNPAISFGIGPNIVVPTASKDALGSDQWQVGVANVYFNAQSTKFQFGYLLIYRVGIGSSSGHERVNLLAFQPFTFLQLGDGWYTGTAPVWNYSFHSHDYSVPLGARIGKVFRKGRTVYNAFVEPQVSVFDGGPGQPQWQIFVGLNMQF